jgi:polyhydroxyalkanoate synthesis regulator phasin
MAVDNLTDGIKKLLLAGVGAVAATADKSQEIFDDLVKKGELTVEQGKVLNQELKHTVKETVSREKRPKEEETETKENPIRDLGAMVAGMTAEQLETLKAKIQEAEEAVKTADTDTKDGE